MPSSTAGVPAREASRPGNSSASTPPWPRGGRVGSATRNCSAARRRSASAPLPKPSRPGWCAKRPQGSRPAVAAGGCSLRLAGAHPDHRLVTFEENPNTELRTRLVIDQVRGLSGSMQMTSQRGGAQVVLIDPADTLNLAAANALLKTLEEPANNRFLLLVSAAPNRLPATIRSRCQRIDFALSRPAKTPRRGWRRRGHPAARAAEALDAAQGHPGLADAWLRGGHLGLRETTLKEWAGVARGIASAARRGAVVDGRTRARPAAVALRGRCRGGVGAFGGRGAAGGGLTPPADIDKLAAWFGQLNRALRLHHPSSTNWPWPACSPNGAA